MYSCMYICVCVCSRLPCEQPGSTTVWRIRIVSLWTAQQLQKESFKLAPPPNFKWQDWCAKCPFLVIRIDFSCASFTAFNKKPNKTRLSIHPSVKLPGGEFICKIPGGEFVSTYHMYLNLTFEFWLPRILRNQILKFAKTARIFYSCTQLDITASDTIR